MSYTAPDNTAVDFEFDTSSSYSSPSNTSVNFTFDKTTDKTKVAATISKSTTTSGISNPSYSPIVQESILSKVSVTETVNENRKSIIFTTTIPTVTVVKDIGFFVTVAKSTITSSISTSVQDVNNTFTITSSVESDSTPSISRDSEIKYIERISLDNTNDIQNITKINSVSNISPQVGLLTISLDSVILSAKTEATELDVLSITSNGYGVFTNRNSSYKEKDIYVKYNKNNEVEYNND